MIDKILDRYGSRNGNSDGANDNATPEDNADDFGSFGFLRGSRERATMLELRRLDGSVISIAYGYIDKAKFDPGDGITLRHVGEEIHIKGRNLNHEVHPKVRLFEAICRHRVPWLREASESESLAASKNDVVIESVE